MSGTDNKIIAVRIHAGFNAGVFLGGLLVLTEQTAGLAGAYLRSLFPGAEAEVALETASVNGIAGWRADVVTPPEHAHRHPSDIFEIYEKSRLSAAAREKARAVWMIVARAEAKVHNAPLDVVHFHEVGRMSNILAIGLCAEYLTTLAPAEIAASPVPMGDGIVRCAHGEVPFPRPGHFRYARRRSRSSIRGHGRADYAHGPRNPQGLWRALWRLARNDSRKNRNDFHEAAL